MNARSGPHVLQIGLETPSTRPGGLNRYFADLCAALTDTGVSVQALTIGDESAGDLPSWWELSGRRGEPLPRRLWRGYVAARRHAGVDLVDCHFALAGWLPTAVGPLRHVRLVVHFQGPWAEESALVGSSRLVCWAKRRIELAVFRRAESFVVLTRAFGEVLIESYRVAPWRVRVLAPGVDLTRFSPGSRAEARERLGLPTDAWIVVAVRRLVPRMGLDILLAAWQRVERETDRSSLLVVVGEGLERGSLERMVDGRGLVGCVRFAGRVDDTELVDYYRAADLSVVPSVALEGFGLVVLESMAAGTPTIVSDVGGLPEAVEGLGGDPVVKAGDPDALADRLVAVAQGTKPLAGEEECRWYAESFSWEEVARRHLPIYRPAVDGEERIRVVVLGHVARLSGGEIALVRLLPSLVARGVDVHVILAEDGPLVDLLRQTGATVEILPMSERARDLKKERVRTGAAPVAAACISLAYSIRLARRLRYLRPDLVHTNTLKAMLYGGVACRLSGIPCLWHVHSQTVPEYLPAQAVRLVRAAARVLPTAVVANSRATLATMHLRSPGAVGIDRGHVVPSPLDSRPAPPRSAAGGPLRVGMVGRIAPLKGQDVFLRAFARAFPDGPEQAVIVGAPLFGEDAYLQEIEELADKLGVKERVHFIGFREDVSEEMATLDILVHASIIPEGFGLVVVEGMAAGLAVVAADAGGPSEIVSDGGDGLLYPPGDFTALAAQLQRLASDSELRRRLGEAAQVTATAYRPEEIAPRIRDVYEAILRRNAHETSWRRGRVVAGLLGGKR